MQKQTRSSSVLLIRLCTVLCLLGLLLSGCANKDEKASKGSEQEIYDRAQRYLHSNNWELAIESLQSLEEYYPFGAYSEHSQLELIFAYFRAGEFEASLSASERFIRLHPQHRNVDYAYYMRGISGYYNDSAFSALLAIDVSKRDAGTAKEAFDHFSSLLKLFPNSAYALDAKKRMIYLRNTLARGEINVANYYFKRGAYLAAANRGRWVIENMQETPAAPDALAVMAQAYHLLDMQDLSDNAVKTLSLNYSNHPALKSGKFDYLYGRQQQRSLIQIITFGIFEKRPAIKFDSRKEFNSFYSDDDDPALEPPKA